MTDNKKFCTHCGTENLHDSNFCGKCGAGISNINQNTTSTYCTKCGTEMNNSESYCQNCGQAASKIYAKETIERISVLPQNIRDQLKNYEKIYPKASCSECGYTGKMGLIKKILPWYGTWWGITLLSIITIPSLVFPLMWIPAGIIVFSYSYILEKDTKYELNCPNCNSHLFTNR
jgi:Zn finger protein HypA/HybF involved in hydrogenase expression